MEPPHPRRIPFNQRWDLHKAELEKLYLHDNLTVPQIMKVMRDEKDFDANAAQYKYRFGQWGWKKNVAASKKRAVLDISQRRAQLGKATMAFYKGRAIEAKKLRREAKNVNRMQLSLVASAGEQGPQDKPLFASNHLFGGRIFMNWNLPFRALARQFPQILNHPSPFGLTVSTPSDVSISSPPGNAPSSPVLSQELRSRIAIEKAQLFIAGKHDDLLRSLNMEEKKSLATWLHQFWMFGFKTAKFWGRGPRNWTAETLGFSNSPSILSMQSPISTTMHLSAAPSPAVDSPESSHLSTSGGDPSKPTPLCRWSIHVFQEDYEEIPCASESESESAETDGNISKDWPLAWHQPSFDQKLSNNLESNDFSSMNAYELPIAVEAVAKAAQNSSKEIFEEALGFAIMARNPELVCELLRKKRREKYDISSLNPCHLATTYLDGSKSCCQILALLLEFGARQTFTNPAGHTVLDNLMITILKSHTSVPPGKIDDALKSLSHFPGEEVDICGRWDADSACYRSLVATGRPAVPPSWKHKFCHTSIQTTCHCIEALDSSFFRSTFFSRTPSGLFLKRCFCCGAKLQLLPLHALVLTGFYLGQFGSDEEDLFGMVCCLLCLLSCASDEIDISEPVEISLTLLLNDDTGEGCSHESFSPAELAEVLSPSVHKAWPENARLGWQVFSYILREAEDQRRSRIPELLELSDGGSYSSRDYEVEHDEIYWTDSNGNFQRSCTGHFGGERPRAFGRSDLLGPIWAAAQAELLTYRRITQGDSWISERFDMCAVLQSLESKKRISMPLLDDSMLKPFCACGRFGRRSPMAPLHREDAAAFYFSNLEDWRRTTIIDDQLLDL